MKGVSRMRVLLRHVVDRLRHGRHRRRSRLLRAALYTLCGLVVLPLAAAGIYAATVPLPADPFQPQQSTLYYSDGHTVLARIGIVDRTDVPLRDVPLVVRRAVLAAEDRDFYHHGGVSARGIARAIWADLTSGAGEGASTITQQYVRNAYLTLDRTAARKSKEIVLSEKLESRYSKDQILERYLNTIYFGRGAYGIDAAARAYFGVEVGQLSTAQAMVLASVIKDPTNFDPAVDAKGAKTRWRYVRDGMLAERWLTAGQAAALRYPVVRAPGAEPFGLSGPTGLIAERVEQELAGHGITAQELRTRGLSVVTTIDRRAQQAAGAQVAQELKGQPAGIRAALVSVDPASGGVRAYYGGADGYGYFDDAAAARPPAGTFTPLVLAAALDHGMDPDSVWDGSSPQQFADRGGVPLVNPGGIQCPRCSLVQALAESLPTVFYHVAEWVDPVRVVQVARAAGIPAGYDGTPSLVDGPDDPQPSLTRPAIALGVYPVSAADLASTYATIANQGTAVARHFVAAVAAPDGGALYTAHPATHRAVSKAAAVDTTRLLADSGGAAMPLALKADTAGAVPTRSDRATPYHPSITRAGTEGIGDTADNRSAWQAGYTAQLATVVWFGRADGKPLRDATQHPITGNGLPAVLWHAYTEAALAGQAGRPLPGDVFTARPPAPTTAPTS
jgi:membrane peptidoglycan carboxypeptidase